MDGWQTTDQTNSQATVFDFGSFCCSRCCCCCTCAPFPEFVILIIVIDGHLVAAGCRDHSIGRSFVCIPECPLEFRFYTHPHCRNMKIGTMICILLVPISIRNVNIHKFARRLLRPTGKIRKLCCVLIGRPSGRVVQPHRRTRTIVPIRGTGSLHTYSSFRAGVKGNCRTGTLCVDAYAYYSITDWEQIRPLWRDERTLDKW